MGCQEALVRFRLSGSSHGAKAGAHSQADRAGWVLGSCTEVKRGAVETQEKGHSPEGRVQGADLRRLWNCRHFVFLQIALFSQVRGWVERYLYQRAVGEGQDAWTVGEPVCLAGGTRGTGEG